MDGCRCHDSRPLLVVSARLPSNFWGPANTGRKGADRRCQSAKQGSEARGSDLPSTAANNRAPTAAAWLHSRGQLEGWPSNCQSRTKTIQSQPPSRGGCPWEWQLRQPWQPWNDAPAWGPFAGARGRAAPAAFAGWHQISGANSERRAGWQVVIYFDWAQDRQCICCICVCTAR